MFALAALGLSLFLLQGCGGNVPGTNVCDPNTGICSFYTPEPTPSPTPLGCVDPQNVQLLYPVNYPAVNYQNTMYFTAQAGVSVSPYLAMELMYETNQTNSPWYTEIGSTVVNVTDDVPSYVPTPPPGYSTVYESQNLPIPQNAGIRHTCD